MVWLKISMLATTLLMYITSIRREIKLGFWFQMGCEPQSHGWKFCVWCIHPAHLRLNADFSRCLYYFIWRSGSKGGLQKSARLPCMLEIHTKESSLKCYAKGSWPSIGMWRAGRVNAVFEGVFLRHKKKKVSVWIFSLKCYWGAGWKRHVLLVRVRHLQA